MTTGSKDSSALRWAIATLAGLMVATVAAEPRVVRDVDYRAEAESRDGRDLLDIHMPDGAREAPVIVYFHGGGLLYGDKSLGDIVAARLLPHGIGLVSANYRLSPGVRHPAHVQDAAAATAWVVKNIAAYGGDPGNVFVAGHSAGAYLAALLAVDPGYFAAHGLGFEQLRGSIPISAFLYVEETAPERPKTVWGEDPEGWLAASVTPHIAPAARPMLLIYADGDDDWRRAQNERFANAMRAEGNAVRAVEVPDRDHASLISAIREADDEIGGLIAGFVDANR